MNVEEENDIEHSWIMILTDEELKQMKKALMIAPWTELDLSFDEKIRNEKERTK